jgi:hypothetical protein
MTTIFSFAAIFPNFRCWPILLKKAAVAMQRDQ